MKAESTIRRTMQRLCKEGRGNGSQERCRMAFDMATALQWVIEGTCWNPVSFLDAYCGKNEEDENGSGQS